jgi:hypothetical protein
MIEARRTQYAFPDQGVGGRILTLPPTERGGDVLVAVPKPFPMAMGHRRPESFPKGGSVKMRPALGEDGEGSFTPTR